MFKDAYLRPFVSNLLLLEFVFLFIFPFSDAGWSWARREGGSQAKPSESLQNQEGMIVDCLSLDVALQLCIMASQAPKRIRTRSLTIRQCSLFVSSWTCWDVCLELMNHGRNGLLAQKDSKEQLLQCLSSCHCALPGSIFWTWLPKLPRSGNAGKSEGRLFDCLTGMKRGDFQWQLDHCDSQFGSSFGCRQENENRVFACTTSNYSGFFSMVKPGAKTYPPYPPCPGEDSFRKKPVRKNQVLELLPPVLTAWRSACQAERCSIGSRISRFKHVLKVLKKMVLKWFLHVDTARLLCSSGAWWECLEKWHDLSFTAELGRLTFHLLTWQIFWKVQSPNMPKSIHSAVLAWWFQGKLPDFELGDDDYEFGCLKLFDWCLKWCSRWDQPWDEWMSGVDHSLLTNHNDFDCLMRHLRPDIDEGGTGIESSFSLEFGILGLGLQLINSKTRILHHFDWFWLSMQKCEHRIQEVLVSEPNNWNLGCWIQDLRVSKSRHKAGSFQGGLGKHPHFWATLWGSAGFGSSDHHTDAEDLRWGNWVLQPG